MLKPYVKVIKGNELEQSTLIMISKITILASIIFLMFLIMSTKTNSEIGAPPVGGGDIYDDFIVKRDRKIIKIEKEER